MGRKWDRFKAGFGSLSSRRDTWVQMIDDLRGELTRMGDMLDSINADTAQPLIFRRTSALQQFEVAKTMYSTADTDTKRKAAITKLEGIEQDAFTLLKDIKAALRLDPSGLMGQVGGKEMLDELVGEIKWDKNRTTDKDFAKSALKARYGLTSLAVPTGKQERKSLKALYTILGTLPDDHVRTNDSLKVLKHKLRPETDREANFAGVYRATEQEIELIERDVEDSGTHAPDCEECTDPRYKPTGSIEGFVGTTTHEVGHAVDDKHNIMDSQSGADKVTYGGWVAEDSRSVAKALGTRDGFLAAFNNLPEDFLLRFLSGVLVGQTLDMRKRMWTESADSVSVLPSKQSLMDNAEIVKQDLVRQGHDTDDDWPELSGRKELYSGAKIALISTLSAIVDQNAKKSARVVGGRVLELILVFKKAKSAAIDQALDEFGRYTSEVPDWVAMEGHDATKLCAWIYEEGFKGSKGLWGKGKAGADKTKVGNRCYTVTNNGDFYSYHYPNRQQGVSNYQFNAPPEWFAELYMYYFNGKLPDSHPAVDAFLSGLRA
ncbi:MAG: hypothetical protein H6740_25635 [Alphaproteobacteria bacterium]|nr:hypothetical protein [Alphaproteobacteria bacterium]